MLTIILLLVFAVCAMFSVSLALGAHALGDDGWSLFAAMAGFFTILFIGTFFNRLKHSRGNDASESEPAEPVTFVSHAMLLLMIGIAALAMTAAMVLL